MTSTKAQRNIWRLLILIYSIFLISSSPINDEQIRKNMVQTLVEQLDDESIDKQLFALTELREIYVRKRDIPDLNLAISQELNPNSIKLLRDLISFIEVRWRLPEKGWVGDHHECVLPYAYKSIDLESAIFIYKNSDRVPTPLIEMSVMFPIEAGHIPDVIKLISNFEPESLILTNGWSDIAFLSSLTSLKHLSLESTKEVDLTPLQKLPNLERLKLMDTEAINLSPLKKMPNLKFLFIEKSEAIDLTPLEGTSIKVINN